MSHEIETNGSEAAFYSTEREWHGLGTAIPEGLSLRDALELAKLTGWNVRKTPMSTRVGSRYLAVPDRFALVRDNPFTGELDVLGDCSGKYRTQQNESLADFAEALVGESEESLTAQVAASLFGGRRVFMSLKLPVDVTLDIGGVADVTEFYLLLSTGHTGNDAFRVDVTAVRAVCANTLPMAQGAARSTWSMWHLTDDLSGKAEQAREVLGIGWKYAAAFEAEAKALYEAEVTTAKFLEIVEAAFPLEKEASKVAVALANRKRGEVQAVYHNAPTMDGIRGTAWGAWQALTEWSDWTAPVIGGDDETKAARKFVSKTEGTGAAFKIKALELVKSAVDLGHRIPVTAGASL